ncbi:GNAT family N-acetyltransferase [Sporosarcina sp. Te-1]|nr:GNAT family N-acetyltransferase [Sporosarcina sp. Te-1]
MSTIQRIYKENYLAGKKVRYCYTSEKYYEVDQEEIDKGWVFTLREECFDKPFVKSMEENIFEEYKEGAEAYTAEVNGTEAGIMMIQEMDWNHTLLIHDLHVYPSFQKKRIGRKFIDMAKQRAVELGARSIVLETQTSNYPAIQFYLRNGFRVVGLNTISYSNEDVVKNEVRLEMAYIVNS